MKQLTEKLLALINERRIASDILEASESLRLRSSKEELSVDTTRSLFGTPMTIFRSSINDAMTQYISWIDTKIKQTAQEIIDG